MGRSAMMLALALGACAAPPQGSATQASTGSVLLAAIGEPFLIAGKLPVCALTLVAAGPIGAVAQLTDPASPLGHDVKQGLADGIDTNCGPPYYVSP